MKFEDNAQYAKHLQKFCNGSVYEDVEKLDRRLMEIGANKLGSESNPFAQDLELKDLKEYVKHIQKIKVREQSIGDDGYSAQNDISPGKKEVIDHMSLGELRNFFAAEHSRREDIERHALREREKSLIDELNMIKTKR